MFKVNRKMVNSYITSVFREINNRSDRYVLPKPRIDLYKTMQLTATCMRGNG